MKIPGQKRQYSMIYKSSVSRKPLGGLFPDSPSCPCSNFPDACGTRSCWHTMASHRGSIYSRASISAFLLEETTHHVQSPFAGYQASDARSDTCFDQGFLSNVVLVLHCINEGKHGMNTLKSLAQSIDILIVFLRPANTGPGFIIGRILVLLSV